MHYRHILTFEDNAELSAIHLSNGKLALRVRCGSAKSPAIDVTQNHLYPLYCSKSDESGWQISAGGVSKAVGRRIWEMIDRINRSGEFVFPDASPHEARQAQKRVNAILESVGLKYRVHFDGIALRPEFIDRQTEI